MKNSILEKARWLREVALATSKNNGARVEREWLKYAAMFVMLFTIGSGNVWGETLFSQTGSSGYTIPSGWSQTNVSGGSYLLFNTNGSTLTSPLYEPHDNLSLAYTVASYGSGTDHPLVIQLLDEDGTVKASHTTGTPTSKSYINTNSPWSIGDVGYKFRIKFYLESAGKGVRLRNFSLTGDAAAPPTTTVTASPASITFDRVTLDPEYGAKGSKNVTISLTNGNVGYPGGVPCYLNGWVETDETDCEFYVNSLYAYQKATSTTSETLSLSYYATDAGTFTGNFIIQGFNASQEAVNCTIPLSVIVDAPACDKTVTINKGTETNCSFTLSMSGAQASCAGVSTTVTVTPNTGYESPSVTQSGASNTPTITGSGTSWTVTYPANTTGTSVINVSCSAKTTTISFDQNGGTGGQTSTKTATYGQAMPTPITTPTRTGYTFEGYYDGSGGTGNKYYNADGSSAANWNKDAATATLYAKWTANKYTVTWSVNGSTYTTTENVAYNTTTLTPANPDVPGECTGSTFMGWTENSSWASDSAPGDLFNGTTPTITGNKTFYAVFADEN